MSEEEEPGELARRRWILDPIDGTTNLVFGYNMSSVSLALVEDERPVFGVVYNPFADEVFCAEAGRGATLNGAPIAVVDRPVDGCLIEFGAGSTRKHEADEAFDVAKNVFKHCLDLRRICSSALAICFVACGRINGYFEKRLKPWDYAAACLILAEAGGQSSNWDGAPMQYARRKASCADRRKLRVSAGSRGREVRARSTENAAGPSAEEGAGRASWQAISRWPQERVSVALTLPRVLRGC